MPDRKPTMEDMETGTGLRDDFDAVISHFWFGFKKEYQDKGGAAPQGFVLLKGPDLEKDVQQGYYTGDTPEWQVLNEGAEIVSAKNPDLTRFNSKSRAGQLVDAMLTAVGKGDKKEGQKFFVARGFFMTQAGFYKGLNFHWKTKKLANMDGSTNDVLLPDRFLGTADGSTAPEPGKTEATDETEKKVLEMASGKTPKELKQALVSTPGVKDNKELLNKVFNKGYLDELEKAGKLAKDPNGKYI